MAGCSSNAERGTKRDPHHHPIARAQHRTQSRAHISTNGFAGAGSQRPTEPRADDQPGALNGADASPYGGADDRAERTTDYRTNIAAIGLAVVATEHGPQS